MNELLGELEGFIPEINEDDSIDFSQPVKCGGVATVKEGGRNKGVGKTSGNEYDFLTIKMQIGEVIDGDAKAIGRFIDKSYALTDKVWDNGTESKASDNVKRLLNDLFTMGQAFNVPQTIEQEDFYEALTVHLGGLTDKNVSVRCYPTKGGKQAVKIVKEIKKKGEVKASSDKVPF